jgi:hypothetical protein
MNIGMADMTNVNGTFSLFLTAENAVDRRKLEELRRRLQPIDFAARGLDPSGTGEELLVIPLEHLLVPKTPTAKSLPDSGFKAVIDGLSGRKK